MKMLNLTDKLSIEEVDNNITEINFHITKEMLDYSLKEIYTFISNSIQDSFDLFTENVCINMYADKGISKEDTAFLYFSTTNVIVSLITTEEQKFEEKILRARDEIISEVVLHNHSINKLLNYKSIINNLQINLFRRKKKVLTLV